MDFQHFSAPGRFPGHGRLRLVPALALCAAAAGVGMALPLALRLRQATRLCRQSRHFEIAPARPAARLLLVGDSTAVGTGASTPEASVAGLIARHHPGVHIANRAQVGARFADIARQLDGAERFDIILILGGGNDVIRLTDAASLQASIGRALRKACARAGSVVLMPAGNVGNTPFFPQPWAWLMTRRSRQLHAMVRAAAASAGAQYVNGYRERADDPFVRQAQLLNARDGLHPSDAGYRLWFEALQLQAGLSRQLQALGAA
ncbi:MAG: family lipase [Polaromonas sp.]|jgi:lysophospholipase L1-like esterase|nr:family lipase [Polaromonas sp.]